MSVIPDYSVILYAAASAQLGLILKTNDPFKARVELYKIRNQLNDAQLKELTIRVAPEDTEKRLILINKNASNLMLNIASKS